MQPAQTSRRASAPGAAEEAAPSTSQPMAVEGMQSSRKKKRQSQTFTRSSRRRRSNDGREHSQAASSSGTLNHDSIDRGFWTEHTSDLSRQLWLPTKNEVGGQSSTNLGLNSWYTATVSQRSSHHGSLETILQQLTFALHQGSVTSQVKKQTGTRKRKAGKSNLKTEQEKPAPGKVRKIRLFPDKEQKPILNQWFGTARWTYNQVLARMKEDWKKYKRAIRVLEKGEVQFDRKELQAEYIPDRGRLRAGFINNVLFKDTDKAWVINTPSAVRDEAMIDVLKAYKSNFSKLENNPEHRFSLKFRSKHAESQSIVIHSRHWKSAGIFHPKRWTKEPLRAAEPLPDNLMYDTRMVRDRLGRFYLCQILPLQEVKVDQPREKIIALDPGVRTFMTGYSPEGSVMEWGKGDMQRIVRLCRAHDKIQSRLARKEGRHRTRYRMRRKVMPRIRRKIRNLVDEVHKKLTKWLVSNYETILLPKFETSQMVTRAKRRIGSKTARQMLTWSHYRFQQRLLNKTREYRGSHVIVCDEAYTSKTCGHCGRLHEKLGGSKTFRCPHCGVTMDRDMNGARNILLRYLTLRAVPHLRDGVGS